MRFRPVSPSALADEIAERALGAPARWTRVLVDGAPAADPHTWAARIAEAIRAGGRPVLHASAEDFLRPASVRLERGRADPDAYYEDRLDVGGLRRTLIDPLGPAGDGRVVARFWNAATDRAAREPFTTLPPGGVCVLDGSLLFGLGLPVELSVHLWLSPGALARRTAPDRRWTLPAVERHEREALPVEVADITVKVDHPDRPAVLEVAPAG